MRALLLAAVAIFAVLGAAQAQTKTKYMFKPTHVWETCTDGDQSCKFYCETQKGGSEGCYNDCPWRMQACMSKNPHLFPWGARGDQKIGPLKAE